MIIHFYNIMGNNGFHYYPLLSIIGLPNLQMSEGPGWEGKGEGQEILTIFIPAHLQNALKYLYYVFLSTETPSPALLQPSPSLSGWAFHRVRVWLAWIQGLARN